MKRLLATTAIMAALAVPAYADYAMTGFDVAPGAQSVQITNPVNANVSAGEIVLHSTSQGDLTVWCLDLQDFLIKPYTFMESVYTAGQSRPGLPAGGLSVTQVRAIASLMEFGLTVNPDADSDAAVQLAIWKEEYGAGFSDTGVGASLAAKVLVLLADAANGGLIDCPTCTLTVLSDAVQAPNQALGFASIPVPAPALGAGLPGLMAACAGLWAFAKRRRSRA